MLLKYDNTNIWWLYRAQNRREEWDMKTKCNELDLWLIYKLHKINSIVQYCIKPGKLPCKNESRLKTIRYKQVGPSELLFYEYTYCTSTAHLSWFPVEFKFSKSLIIYLKQYYYSHSINIINIYKNQFVIWLWRKKWWKWTETTNVHLPPSIYPCLFLYPGPLSLSLSLYSLSLNFFPHALSYSLTLNNHVFVM